METTQFKLTRNKFRKLIVVCGGEIYEGVIPVRAFPLQTPNENIALVSVDGHEVAWINNLSDVSEEVKQLLLEDLSGREIVPEIQKINGVSSYSTPSTWMVQTDRGATSFVLRVEEDIRRLGESLLITDNHGIQFLIREPAKLDKVGRKILDRFL